MMHYVWAWLSALCFAITFWSTLGVIAAMLVGPRAKAWVTLRRVLVKQSGFAAFWFWLALGIHWSL